MTLLVPAPSFAQESIDAIPICSFYVGRLDEQIYTFGSDREMETRVLQMTTSFTNKSLRLSGANVDDAVAVLENDGVIVLYNQFLFATLGEEGNGTRKALTNLGHQLAHLILEHTPAETREESLYQELDADRLAGKMMYASGMELSNLNRELLSGSHGFPDEPDFPRQRLDRLRTGWQEARQHIAEYTSAENEDIPSFRWPPPAASAQFVIPESFLRPADGSEIRLQDVANRLETAMDETGYFERSYYAVPDGFALATRAEQIEADGSPKVAAERWIGEYNPPKVFSLASYISALLTGNEGHYRIVVFIFTPRSFSQSDEPVEFSVSRDWIWSGGNTLPPSIGIRPYSADYSGTALIYEFVQASADSSVEYVRPSRLNGRDHLVKAGLWSALRN